MAIKIKSDAGKVLTPNRYAFLAARVAVSVGALAGLLEAVSMDLSDDDEFDLDTCDVLADMEANAKDLAQKLADLQSTLHKRVRPAANAKPVSAEELEDAEDEG